MADAQATFALTLDSSGLRSGVDSGLSSLDKMRQKIQSVTKVLQGHKTAMDNLGKTESVKRFQALPKEMDKAQAEARRLESQLAKVKKAQESHGNASVVASPDALAEWSSKAQVLENQAKSLEAQIGGVTGKIKQLDGEFEKLKDDEAVKAFGDHSKGAKAAEKELSELQTAFSRAGGDASTLGDKVEEPKQGLGKLLDMAKQAGGPIGAVAGKFEEMGAAGKMGAAGPIAIAVAVAALVVALVKGVYSLAKFALASADAARNAGITTSAAAFGATKGVKDIDAATAALRSNTAKSKDEARALASELYRAGERGAALEDAAVTIGRFAVLGDDAAGAVKGLYDELRKPTPAIGGVQNNSMIITKDQLPRDVFLELANTLGKDANRALVQGFSADKGQIRQALSRIGETRFAGPAEAQMRSLDKTSERLHENLASLFEGLKVGVLLGALQKLVGLLDESSESGKAIRETLAAFAQPFADAVEAALPYLEAFLEGIVFTGLVIALMALKAKNALSGLIPASLTENIDWLKFAFWVGAAAMGIFTAAALALAITLFALATPFLTIVALMALMVFGIVMAIDAIVGWADEVEAAFDGMDFGEIASAIIDGLIGGLKDGAADLFNAFTDLAKGGYEAFKSAIKSKSPSWLFRMAGRTIPQGTALGIEDDSPKVENAAASMVSTDAVEGAGGNGGKRGNGLTVNIQAGAIVIQGANDPESTLEMIERALRTILQRAALEGGQTAEAAE